MLFAAIAPKHVSWLSPIWLLGVGALATLVLLAFLWWVFWSLSRFRAIGELAENPVRFRRVSFFIAAAVFVVVAAVSAIRIAFTFSTSGADAGFPALLRSLALAIPVFAGIWVTVAALVALSSRRLMSEINEAITEGILLPVMVSIVVLAAIGIAGTFTLWSPAASWGILQSLTRVGSVGTTVAEFTIPASTDVEVLDGLREPPAVPIAVSFRGAELRSLEILSSQDISVVRDRDTQMDSPDSLEVLAGEPFTWKRRGLETQLFGNEEVKQLFVRNRGAEDAKVVVTTTTAVVYPQTLTIPIFALCVAVLVGAYLVIRTIAPRVSAVARATYKSETAQPIFLLAMVITFVFLLLSIYFPYHTFGEDIKMLKDAGLNVIKVASIIVAIWGASTTVADEIEGKTALTVLSKPISRRSFVIGKFLGISWTVALMYILLGLVFLCVVSYKGVYDARESAQEFPSWEVCYLEVMGTVAPLALSFLEAMVLAAISVAISTRLPMLANFTICFTLYALGHLTRTIIEGTQTQFAIVKFFGQLVGVVVPGLEAYDVHSAIDAGLRIPGSYVLVVAGYTVIFALIALLLALLLFEDRDVS